MSSPSSIDSLLLHADFVRRVAVALAGRDGADDLCQDTWAAALQHPPADGSRPRSWLATVARNLFRDAARRSRRQAAREGGEVVEPSVPAIDDIVAREELRRQVVAAVLALSPELRDVVLLRYYEDLDSGAIGGRLGRPAGTVRWQLHAAVQQLRRRLDEQHGNRRAWLVPLGFWGQAKLGAVATVMKVAWPWRAAVVAVLLLAVGWLAMPVWFGASTPPLRAPLPVAAAPGPRDEAPPAEATNERQDATVVAVAAPSHGPEDLWGRVVRAADGAPIADAEVQLQRRDADEFWCNDLAHSRRIDTLATVHTDADGRFAFHVARAHVHRLLVRAAGFAPATATRCCGGSECRVELAPGAVLEGVVREAGTLRPLADVSVKVDRGREQVDLAEGRTAPDGTFRFVDLPATQVQIQVASPRYTGAVATPQLRAGHTEFLHFELSLGRVVTGRIVDAMTGAPIAGAQVDDIWAFPNAAITGVDGLYAIGGVLQRSLYARAEGYVMAVVPLPSTATEVDFMMVRGGGLNGRIIDEQGRPLARGYVAAIATFMVQQGVLDEDWRPCEVEGDGRFACSELDPSRVYVLHARAPGRGARVLSPPARVGGADLEVGDVVLRPEAIMGGQVHETAGAAVPGARIVVHRAAGAAAEPLLPGLGPYLVAEVTADAAGQFAVTGLAAGRYVLRVQKHAGARDVEFGPFELQDGESRLGIELTLADGMTVTGRLLAPGGTLPAGSFELYLHPAKAGQVVWTRSDATGRFRFQNVAAGDYTLGCLSPPAGWAMSSIADVAAGRQDLQVTVFPAEVITGRVVDATGKPARASVHWSAVAVPTMYFHEVKTDADGSFRLEVPPDFVGSVLASDPDNPFRQAKADNVTAGASDVVLRFH